jgi:hypothetical protein
MLCLPLILALSLSACRSDPPGPAVGRGEPAQEGSAAATDAINPTLAPADLPESGAATLFKLYDGAAPASYTYSYAKLSEIALDSTNALDGVTPYRIQLPANEHAGAGIGFKPVDLRLKRQSATLVFWAKGSRGGEIFSVGLGTASTPKKPSIRSTVALPSPHGLSTSWEKYSIPLSKLSDQGRYWDGSKNIEVAMNWAKTIEFIVNRGPKDEIDILIGAVYIVE